MRRFVSVEESESREVGSTLRLNADLNEVVLVKNSIVFAIKSGRKTVKVRRRFMQFV